MNFTERMGIEIPEHEIVVRNDAPADFRLYLLQMMLRYAGLKKVRTCVCFVTKEAEDRNNWAENEYMKSEVQSILENWPWYRIYDIIESFFQQINDKIGFEKEVNEYFVEKGIGWKLIHGILETRGEEAFEKEIKDVVDILGEAKLHTTQTEIREALKDMSKRPIPDITGSVQHSVAALECLCREITGEKNLTLGKLINTHSQIIPKHWTKWLVDSLGLHQSKVVILGRVEHLIMKKRNLLCILVLVYVRILRKRIFPPRMTISHF